MDMDFAGVIGHDRVKELFRRALKHDRLGQGYLFVGPDGVGRTTFAKQLLRTLFPLGSLDAHPDILYLARSTDKKTGKQKKSISVQQVRELRERLGMSSAHAGGYKAIWIEEAHTLSMGAANALLKVLEEPKGKTIFLLRAPSRDSVPQTILSRCQVIRFAPLSKEQLTNAFASAKNEEVEAALLGAQGCPGRVMRFLEGDEEVQTEMLLAKAVMSQTSPFVYEEWRATYLAFQQKKTPKLQTAKRLLAAYETATRTAWNQAMLDQPHAARRHALARRLEMLPSVHAALSHNVQPELALERLVLLPLE